MSQSWLKQDRAGIERTGLDRMKQDWNRSKTARKTRLGKQKGQGKTRFRQGKVRKSSGKADKVRYGARAGTQN